MPIETHLHYDPLWSMVVVFGVNLALPLLMALGFVITGLRREGDERGAYLGLARWTVIVCVLMQLLCASYHARLFAGTAEVGTVAKKEEIASSRYPQCELTLQTAHGELELDVPLGSCRNALEPGTRVPIITVAGSTMFAQAGERATANAGLTLGLVPLMLLVVVGLVVRFASRSDEGAPS
jgi:hypothetical protein